MNELDLTITFTKEPTEFQKELALRFVADLKANDTNFKTFIGTPIPPKKPE